MKFHGNLAHITLAAASLLFGACQGSSVLADRQPRFEVPAGTQIFVRLEQGISSEKNSSGEQFRAQLDKPIEIDGKLLAPAGTEVTGELTHVKEAGRVKGRASMTLILTKLAVEESDYEIETKPMTIEASGSEKKDAEVIAGGAAVGAIIGAIAGGGKGAAIGAGAGAGAGTGAVLYTKGDEVKFDPETRFAFRLKSPVELPVYQK